MARALEYRNNSVVSAYSNPSKSVRWDQSVQDSKPAHKAGRQRRRKKSNSYLYYEIKK